MGKNKVVRSLGKIIGNVAMHKILLNHTNKPESKNHLSHEVIEYSADAYEKTLLFNWNEKDKIEIKKIAMSRVRNLSKNYPDVVFDEKEVIIFIEETIDEII